MGQVQRKGQPRDPAILPKAQAHGKDPQCSGHVQDEVRAPQDPNGKPTEGHIQRKRKHGQGPPSHAKVRRTEGIGQPPFTGGCGIAQQLGRIRSHGRQGKAREPRPACTDNRKQSESPEVAQPQRFRRPCWRGHYLSPFPRCPPPRRLRLGLNCLCPRVRAFSISVKATSQALRSCSIRAASILKSCSMSSCMTLV